MRFFRSPVKKVPSRSVELPGDVVLAVEVVLAEDLGEDLLGQDVLDQHLAHVGRCDVGIDADWRAKVKELLPATGEEGLVILSLNVDHFAEGAEDNRNVMLEPLHRLVE